jgi:hypothetical protein
MRGVGGRKERRVMVDLRSPEQRGKMPPYEPSDELTQEERSLACLLDAFVDNPLLRDFVDRANKRLDVAGSKLRLAWDITGKYLVLVRWRGVVQETIRKIQW